MTRQRSNQSESIAVYNAKVTAIPALERGMAAGRLAELAALVEMTIGPLPQAVLDRLLEVQTDLQTSDSKASAMLASGDITSDRYLELLNENMKTAMERNRQILGEERCAALFGPAMTDPTVPTEEAAVFVQKVRRAR